MRLASRTCPPSSLLLLPHSRLHLPASARAACCLEASRTSQPLDKGTCPCFTSEIPSPPRRQNGMATVFAEAVLLGGGCDKESISWSYSCCDVPDNARFVAASSPGSPQCHQLLTARRLRSIQKYILSILSTSSVLFPDVIQYPDGKDDLVVSISLSADG